MAAQAQPRSVIRAAMSDKSRIVLLEGDMDAVEGDREDDLKWIRSELTAVRRLLISMMVTIVLACIGTMLTMVFTQ